MIIMINGAFGVGKTTIANELLGQIENSMLFDPEYIGFMLRHILTKDDLHEEERTDNFQDMKMWPELTVHVARLLKVHYKKHLIVPMTIFNKHYFQFIFHGFKEIDEDTFHFCLGASKETIDERLRKRGEEEGNWCFQQTEKCVKAFSNPIFQEYIDTDDMSVASVLELILNSINGSRG